MRINMVTHWALFSAPLLITLAVITLFIGTGQDVVDYFEAHRIANPDITFALKAITDWSNSLFYVIYGVMLIQAFRKGDFETKRYMLILLAVQLFVALVCVNLLKHGIGRSRPGQGWEFHPMTTKGVYHSMPSGHTTEIVGWSLPMAFRHYRVPLTAALGLLVGLVGFSRIYLGWHHTSDVFAGLLLGSCTAVAISHIAASSLFRKKA